MTIIVNDAFDRVVQRRANRLGISVDQVKSGPVSRPRYLMAAENAAARLGTTPENVLQEDLRRLENSTYPTPDCITPDDLEDLSEMISAEQMNIEEVLRPEGRDRLGPIWSNRLSHLTSCDPCRTLLIASQPNQERVDQFARFVKELYSTVAVGD
jgi:hypothetical protein